MEIVLLRHARCVGNDEGAYIGRTDSPLTPSGQAAAVAAGGFSSVARVYASPMLRARQTASLLFPAAQRVTVDDLREMDFGAFEGRAFADLADDGDYRTWVAGGCMGVTPGGEGTEDFCTRVCAAFDRLIEGERAAGRGRTVIVAHGGTLMAIMSRRARPSRPFHEWHADCLCGWHARAVAGVSPPELTDVAAVNDLSALFGL